MFQITNEFGNPKYRYVTHLIKSVIILSHGNAVVERSFSTNALFVTSAEASYSPALSVAL